MPTRSSLSRRLTPLALGALLLGAAALWLGAMTVSAHAELDRSIPAQGDLLAAPPDRVELWFTELVNPDDGSLGVTLRTEDNTVIEPRSLIVDPADPHHVVAEFGGLNFETYTVAYSNRSATDGHPSSGSFAFRVGGGPTPGAATTADGSPALWAVVTRWATFLGLAIAGGAFFIARTVLGARGRAEAGDGLAVSGGTVGPVAASRALRLLAVGGAAVALLATLAELPLQWEFPPGGTTPASFRAVLLGLPDAWWLRPAGAGAALLAALAWLVLGRSRPGGRPAAVEWFGLGVALSGLLGLALTGHSAAQQGAWHAPAVASNIAHQWSSSLWAGGLVALAVVRWAGPDRGGVALDPVRRFSPWALVLFGIAAVTGVTNAGIILPSVPALWDSRYGVTILVKTAVVLGALALAARHRQALARSAAWATARLRPTLRLESIVIALAIVAASTLALTSPPGSDALSRDPLATDITILEQARTSDGTIAALMRLAADPLRSSATNTFRLTASTTANQPMTAPAGSRAFLDFVSISDAAIVQPRLELQPDGQGGFTGAGDQLSIDSWWRITATLRQAGQEDLVAAFAVLLPDPNLYGTDAVDTPESDPAGQALYQRARDLTAAATDYQDEQFISSAAGGGGPLVESVIASRDGAPSQYSVLIGSISGVAGANTRTDTIQEQVGRDSWRSTDGGTTWVSTFSVQDPLSPADTMEQYDGATGFRLGRRDVVNGELSQAVIFTVPEGRYAHTWYVWWVGTETGRRNGELMITESHYMTRVFTGYDTGATITPPDPATILNDTP